MKTCSNKSNATRAAKKAGLTTGFTIIKEGTGYAFQAAPAPAPGPAPPQGAKDSKGEGGCEGARQEGARQQGRQGAQRRNQKGPAFRYGHQGATTAEIAVAFGWLPHTTRGALSRFCQMYNVEKLKVAGGTRYKIAS